MKISSRKGLRWIVLMLNASVVISPALANECSNTSVASTTIHVVSQFNPSPRRAYSILTPGNTCREKRSQKILGNKLKKKLSRKDPSTVIVKAPFCKIVRAKIEPGKNNVRIKLHCENTAPVISLVEQRVDNNLILLSFSAFDREGDTVSLSIEGNGSETLPSDGIRTVAFDEAEAGRVIKLEASDGAFTNEMRFVLRSDVAQNP